MTSGFSASFLVSGKASIQLTLTDVPRVDMTADKHELFGVLCSRNFRDKVTGASGTVADGCRSDEDFQFFTWNQGGTTVEFETPVIPLYQLEGEVVAEKSRISSSGVERYIDVYMSSAMEKNGRTAFDYLVVVSSTEVQRPRP